MAIAREIKSRARHVVTPVLGATLILYFAYHAVQGERGVLTRWHLEQQIELADDRLAELDAAHGRLENRVRLLRPESLDPDMLDERARDVLGLIGEGETVIVEDR